MNAIHDRPLDDTVRPESVLRVFAVRAAAELDRRNAERELDRQRAFADSLLDMVASLVIVVDPHGRIVRFNRACEQASGWREVRCAAGASGRCCVAGPARGDLALLRRGRSLVDLPLATTASG